MVLKERISVGRISGEHAGIHVPSVLHARDPLAICGIVVGLKISGDQRISATVQQVGQVLAVGALWVGGAVMGVQ